MGLLTLVLAAAMGFASIGVVISTVRTLRSERVKRELLREEIVRELSEARTATEELARALAKDEPNEQIASRALMEPARHLPGFYESVLAEPRLNSGERILVCQEVDSLSWRTNPSGLLDQLFSAEPWHAKSLQAAHRL